LAKNNDNANDPVGDQSVLDNAGISNAYFDYDNPNGSENPTTKSYIEDIVNGILDNKGF